MDGEDLRVEFSSDEDADGDHVEPHQGGHGRPEGAVDDRVVSEAGDVESVEQGDEEPGCGTEQGSGHDAPPVLRLRRAEVVDHSEYGHAREHGDDPSHQAPDKEDVQPKVVVRVLDHPSLDLVAEDDDKGSEEHRHQGDGNEAEGNDALAPEVPRAARQTIGAAEASMIESMKPDAAKTATAVADQMRRTERAWFI